MHHRIGTHAAKKEPVIWDEEALINPHLVVVGDTGSGKTHNLKAMIRSFVDTGEVLERIHVFDVHGDIEVPGASTVMFSAAANCGFNPLEINPDPHYGGVRQRVQSLLRALGRTSQRLGPRQQAVLRHLLLDLYSANRFYADKPASWAILPEDIKTPPGGSAGRVYIDVPWLGRQEAESAGAAFDAAAKAYWVPEAEYEGWWLRYPRKQFGKRHPTMNDLMRYAKSRLTATYLGASLPVVAAVESYRKTIQTVNREMRDAGAASPGKEPTESPKLAKEKEKAVAKFDEMLEAMGKGSGRELEAMMRYVSYDELLAVVLRLENMAESGIYGELVPQLDEDAFVWRYHLKALSDDARRLFADTRLEKILADSMQRGVSPVVREVVVIDEIDLFTCDDKDHVLNRIVNEGRKFGLMAILAGQRPAQFPDDVVAGAATKIFLGVDPFDWAVAQRKFALDSEALKWIVPKQRAIVQMKGVGAVRRGNLWVHF